MPSPLVLLESAIAFYRKQPVLNRVTVWLLILPSFCIRLLARLAALPGETTFWPAYEPEMEWRVLAVILLVLLNVVMLWGEAALLVVGKRLVKSPAGRSRTSFRAVRAQSATFIVPILLTSILRTCFTILWSLLLVVPGVVYLVRTAFFPMFVVFEKIEYRDALRRSIELVRGRTGRVLLVVLGLAMLLLLLPAIAVGTLGSAVAGFDTRLLALSDAVSAVVMGFSGMLFTLGLVSLYAHLVETPATEDGR